jgi:hypothetical protein
MTLTNTRPLIFNNQEIDNCKVGINKKNAPQATLDVNGDTKIDGTLEVEQLNVNGITTLNQKTIFNNAIELSSNDYGTPGFVLMSNGKNSSPSWVNPEKYVFKAFLHDKVEF